jgi:hypothetical protein
MENIPMKKLLLATVAVCALPAVASAGETLTWRHVQHAIDVHRIDVSDAKGHTVTVLHAVGIASFPDGSVGSTDGFGLTDTTNGSGTIQGHFFLKTADGSELRLKYTGTSTAGKIKGTDVVVGGTGKFAGAAGEGTFEGSSLTNNAITMNYIDNVVTLGGGTAADAKAMLEKTAAAIKADREMTLGMITKGSNGFKVGDLYPFCARLTDGRGIASPALTPPPGTDVRHLTDTAGKDFGVEMMAAWAKPEGVITTIEYQFPKPNTTGPSFPKQTLLMRVAPDLGCGVGFYK